MVFVRVYLKDKVHFIHAKKLYKEQNADVDLQFGSSIYSTLTNFSYSKPITIDLISVEFWFAKK